MKKIVFIVGCGFALCIGGVCSRDHQKGFGRYQGNVVRDRNGWRRDILGCNIEIANAAEPVEGTVTITNVPMQMQTDYNVKATITGQSKNGKLTSAGVIMFLGADPSNFFEITSIKDKKMNAWFYANGVKANVTATKK